MIEERSARFHHVNRTGMNVARIWSFISLALCVELSLMVSEFSNDRPSSNEKVFVLHRIGVPSL